MTLHLNSDSFFRPDPFDPATYNPSVDIDKLVKHLRDVFDGNQVKGCELFPQDFSALTFDIELVVNFEFVGEYTEKISAGRHDEHIHFGTDRQGFDKHKQNLLGQCAYNTELRADFIERIIDLETQAFSEIDNQTTFYHYPPYSMHFDCGACRCTGRVSCGSCGGRGKVNCSWCFGTGTETYQTPKYDNKGQIRGYQTNTRSCGACWGSGNKTCGTCGGKGDLVCQDCQGHGEFTKVHTIKAIAKRYYHVNTNIPWYPKSLADVLNSKGLTFCNSVIDFELDSDDVTDVDAHEFCYQAKSIAFHLPFTLKNKNYDCYAFASPPYPYVRPNVFDDLFCDEFSYIKQSFDQKGQIDTQKAFEFFNKYQGQPALDSAMQLLAKGSHSEQSIMLKMLDACEWYVSACFAKDFGLYLSKIMTKISPPNSPVVWFICIVPFLVFVAVFVVYRIQMAITGLFGMIIATVSTLFYAVVGALVVCALAFGASYLHTYVRIQKIPKPYRRAINHKPLIRRTLMMFAFVVAVAYLYGVLTHFGYVSRLPISFYEMMGQKWVGLIGK